MVNHLMDLYHARACIRPVFSMDHDIVVALSSSYTQEYFEMEERLEKLVLGKIKNEFQVNKDAMLSHPPMGTERHVSDYGASSCCSFGRVSRG